MFADDAIRAYLDVFAELGARGDDRGRVNARRQGREISGYGVNEAAWGLNVYPTAGTRASLGWLRRRRWTKVPVSTCRCSRWFLATDGFVRIRA